VFNHHFFLSGSIKSSFPESYSKTEGASGNNLHFFFELELEFSLIDNAGSSENNVFYFMIESRSKT